MTLRTLRSTALRLLASGAMLAMALAAAAQGVNVTTFHNDETRLGWNASETRLTPAGVHVGAFGRLWEAPLDGGVPGSPLYVSGLTLAGSRRDVVYAATDHNSVFALDAATGKVLWADRKLAEPLSEAQFMGSWFGRSVHGILSTPVIDLSAGTLYTCSIRARGLRQLYEMWALDIRTGAVRSGWPVTLRGVYHGTKFEAGQVMQRGALTFADGWVYAPFGGRGDTPPWRGWLMGVDTRHPDHPQRAFCSSPRTDGAGIWSGGGVAVDHKGDLFVTTGNGDFDFSAGSENLSQSVLRLATGQGGVAFTRQTRDYYTPSNYKFLDDQDEDLGGTTALILPDMPDSSTPHPLFVGGKDGLAYLLDRDNLGGIGGELQKTRLFSDPDAPYHEGIRATSCYFDAGDAGRYLYVAGDQPGPDSALGMMALRLAPDETGGPLRMKRVWSLKQPLNGPSSPIVSSDGPRNGIVWVVETSDGNASSLRAYDALTGATLYNSNDGPPSDHFDGGRRFSSPIVADGRVFVGANGLLCYGLKADTGKEAQ